jgi:hypothetical protein
MRRLAILPIENLASDPALAVDAAAIQLAIWDALQAQPNIHVMMAGHGRDLPELRATYTVEGYVAAGRFQLRLNNQAVQCAGSFEDCATRIVADIAKHVAVTPRPIPKPASLRLLAGSPASGRSTESLEKAAKTEPGFAALWLAWASDVQASGGPPAALAVLNAAPLASMAPYDATRIRLRVAELKQDRTARSSALVALARVSPADIELQAQAAQVAAAERDFASAAQLYDRLIALAPDPRFLNQAAYLAAFMNDRTKAEQYASRAQTSAPNEPSFLDTRGEIAYFFSDFAAASRYFEQAANINVTFLNGQALWKAADAARAAGEKPRAETLLARYLEFRTKAGLRNTLVPQAVWEWHGGDAESAIEKLRTATDSLDRGKSLFLLALMALNKRDFHAAEGHRRQLDPNAIETAFLASVMDGAALPRVIPFPPEAIAALHQYLRGNKKAAQESFAFAKPKLDPFTEGQWRKFEAAINGKKPQGLLPASPDDWLAVLLH